MIVRTGEAEWKGNLREGTGTLRSETGAVSGRYSWPSRFAEATGTNPEELIATAHAACFSMAFSGKLTTAGHVPERIHTTARVHMEKLEPGFTIVRIDLICRVRAPRIDSAVFHEQAEAAKKGCPVSRALSGSVEVTLDAALEA